MPSVIFSPKLTGFILLPIYTKLISVADYGILGLFEVVELLGIHILSFGTPQVLLRRHGLTDNELKKKNYIFTLFIFLVCICVGSFLIVLPSRSFLAEFLFDQNIFTNYFFVLFISISFPLLSKIPLTLLLFFFELQIPQKTKLIPKLSVAWLFWILFLI